MEEKKLPKVGIGVIVVKDGKVLIGRRISGNHAGTWCFPGGHLEYGETFEDCAMRETMEESGIKIKNVKFATITNDYEPDYDHHYITVFMISDYDSGNLIPEEGKMDDWKWIEWNDFPQSLLISVESLIKSGYNPFK